MKRLALFAVLAALASSLAFAQAQKADAPAKMESKMEAKTDKAEAPKDAMAPKPVARRLTPKSREDARACLELPTNQEIIVCAEQYL